LQKIAGTDRLKVNSLHWQGVDTLGQGLTVEARAPDGVIEAFSVAGSKAFSMGLQWHPEWQFAKDPFSRALFAAFGTAAGQRASLR
jgi:putative glutamine amidotransferase